MAQCSILILAAGKGVRMRSKKPKVLHMLAGKPMLWYVFSAAQKLKPEKLALVIGHEGQTVEAAFSQVPCVYQHELLGTAHAVLQAESLLGRYPGDLLLLCGDTPLLKPETLSRFLRKHKAASSDLTLLFTRMENPSGYGRLVFGRNNNEVVRIVEEVEASAEERRIKAVNAGIYVGKARLLFDYLKKVKSSAKKGEYFLTDLVEIMVQEGKRVLASSAESEEVMGINCREELARAERIMRQRKAKELMAKGVTLLDPEHTYIDVEVRVGQDSTIYPNCYLLGKTSVGRDCLIEPGCFILDSIIKDGATMSASSVIRGSVIGPGATIGPMAHLRPGSHIGKQSRIGNFVEVKKSMVGPRTKASHLTYLGDSIIGADVNIGAGTITCNYDGKAKHQTVIEDKVFVGSNTMFVAPVRIGKGAVTGAGSTITKDVPQNALAIARAKQVNIPGWRLKKK